MSTETILDRDFIDRLPERSTLVIRNVSWEQYDALVKALDPAPALRVAYGNGTLQLMTLSSAHECYSCLLDRLLTRLTVRHRIKLISFGSTIITRNDKRLAVEPDICFYVHSAGILGAKIDLDFTKDPPPDVAVEIDIHQDSTPTFGIYAALRVPEIWRYDGTALTMHLREGGAYLPIQSSVTLPMLNAATLTRFLNLIPGKTQHDVALAFEEWLASIPG